ncbi:MAG: TRAP transporter small permease [Desulfobacteraceae bacterium]|nr:MAG: TRAP transporter small permease [Desulfobacteraceae bacterium]
MNLKNTANILGLISYLLSRIGCIALFFMMCLTVVDVVGRYIFNAPILGAFEMTEFLVLIMVFSFIGYAQAQKSHVTVDILFDHFPDKIKWLVSFINYLICLGMVFIIAWMGFEKAIESFHTGEKPLNLAIPNHPFVFFLSLGSAVMCVEFVRDIFRKLHELGGEKK